MSFQSMIDQSDNNRAPNKKKITIRYNDPVLLATYKNYSPITIKYKNLPRGSIITTQYSDGFQFKSINDLCSSLGNRSTVDIEYDMGKLNIATR